MSRPGFQNPHFKPHHDLGAMSKSDAKYNLLKDKIVTYLKHADREKQPVVTADELRALDPDFAAGDIENDADALDRERLFGQICWDLGLTPTVIPE